MNRVGLTTRSLYFVTGDFKRQIWSMPDSAPKSIKILYFSILRDQSGVSSERFDTNVDTAEKLFLELNQKYNFSLAREQLRVAVNDKITSWNQKLKSNDVIAFLPPVSGG